MKTILKKLHVILRNTLFCNCILIPLFGFTLLLTGCGTAPDVKGVNQSYTVPVAKQTVYVQQKFGMNRQIFARVMKLWISGDNVSQNWNQLAENVNFMRLIGYHVLELPGQQRLPGYENISLEGMSEQEVSELQIQIGQECMMVFHKQLLGYRNPIQSVLMIDDDSVRTAAISLGFIHPSHAADLGMVEEINRGITTLSNCPNKNNKVIQDAIYDLRSVIARAEKNKKEKYTFNVNGIEMTAEEAHNLLIQVLSTPESAFQSKEVRENIIFSLGYIATFSGNGRIFFAGVEFSPETSVSQSVKYFISKYFVKLGNDWQVSVGGKIVSYFGAATTVIFPVPDVKLIYPLTQSQNVKLWVSPFTLALGINGELALGKGFKLTYGAQIGILFIGGNLGLDWTHALYGVSLEKIIEKYKIFVPTKNSNIAQWLQIENANPLCGAFHNAIREMAKTLSTHYTGQSILVDERHFVQSSANLWSFQVRAAYDSENISLVENHYGIHVD